MEFALLRPDTHLRILHRNHHGKGRRSSEELRKKLWLLALPLLALLGCFLVVSEVRSETKILKRADWKARPAKEREEIRVRIEKELTKRRPAVYLTVHHTGTPAKTMPFAEKLKNHQELMWHYTIDNKSSGKKITTHVILRDTPYHFIVDSTGEVAEGRELRFAAYSNTEYLTPIDQHITVVLEGDFDKGQPTDAQISSLVGLLADLAKR